MDEDWRDSALCQGLDPDYFYPQGIGQNELNKDAMEADAAQFCHDCPVKEACGDFALATNQDEGVWGGMTSKRRKSIRRRRLSEIFEASKVSA